MIQKFKFPITFALALGLSLLIGCATPVGISKTSQEKAQQALTASILSSGEPSAFSRQFLERFHLVDQFDEEAQQVLKQLHDGLGEPDTRERLFALAELSFTAAQKDKKEQASYLAAAIYASAFLFPENEQDSPSPYDPRLRIAMDIYNRGVAKGLEGCDANCVDLSERCIELPFGSLELVPHNSASRYEGYRLTEFISLADLKVRGLRNRYRCPGIGAPLLATAVADANQAVQRWIPKRAKVPLTAFLRFEQVPALLSGLGGKAVIELHDVDKTPTVEIGNYAVPLESEQSAAIAYQLEGSPMWDFELAGFRQSDFRVFGVETEGELLFTTPYRRGRIPVVFVHGTASSPARWGEMLNEFCGDPHLASRYQFWSFIYNSGNPIAFSAMHLRERLTEAIEEIDPYEMDPALRQMVVVGHSQGGLLTKMTTVESGTKFWDSISDLPFNEANLSPDTKDLLKRSYFIEPLPFVKRVIFIATPHRGSYMASNFLGKIVRRTISVPSRVIKASVEVLKLNPLGVVEKGFRAPTAIDNMDWGDPFLRTLADLPINKNVSTHSIIAVKGNGPAEQGKDGVVRFESAHIEGVDSELVVRSGHSTQANPYTIEEVRNILYKHAEIR